MKEPKTLDDYKELLKAFKLKILKQKMRIEELQDTNSVLENQIIQIKTNNQNLQPQKEAKVQLPQQSIELFQPLQLKDVDSSTMEGKVSIMNAFKQGAMNFGITPESIFRIADFQYRNQIQSDYFRNVLSKLKLGLSPKHISSLIYIFDENCRGFITKSDYLQSLHAYQVAMEETSLHYRQECLLKLASIFNEEKINLPKFYDEMIGKGKKAANINDYEKKIKTSFGKKILQRQVVASFNEIDLESDQIIDRQNFLYSITSFINRLISHSQDFNRQPTLFHDMLHSQQTQFGQQGQMGQQTPFSNVQQNVKIPPPNISESRTIQNQNQNQNQNQGEPIQINLLNTKIPLESLNPHEIVQRLNNEFQITVTKIIEEVCRFPLKNRLTIFNFKKALLMLRVMRQDLPIQLINSLYRVIDINHKGSVHFAELLHFCLQNSTDMSIIFRLLGKYFANNDLSGQKFWFLFGINAEHDISKERFLQIMNKNFYIRDDMANNFEKLWNHFDKGRGAVPVAAIIQEMSKYDIQ